jgi:hypothetical protein
VSLNNDYMVQILVRQRHRELLSEAANHRLARAARADRDPWWRRRLLGSRVPPRGRRALGAETVSGSVIPATR